MLSLVINLNQRKANNYPFCSIFRQRLQLFSRINPQNQSPESIPEGLDNLIEAAYYFISLNPDAQKLRNQAF